jgi:ribosomal protein L7/L12
MTNNDSADDMLNYVIIDGVRFLQSITQHYGTERGMAVWEKLGEAMGPEIKGQVFFALLTGEMPCQLRIRSGTCSDAVGAIKAIRHATNMGLKEAKDAWDLSKTQMVTLRDVHRSSRDNLIQTLRGLGMVVG